MRRSYRVRSERFAPSYGLWASGPFAGRVGSKSNIPHITFSPPEDPKAHLLPARPSSCYDVFDMSEKITGPTIEDLLGEKGAELPAKPDLPEQPPIEALQPANPGTPGDPESTPAPPPDYTLPDNVNKKGQLKTSPIAMWQDDRWFKRWLRAVKNAPTEKLKDQVIEETYPAALWRFREAATQGDYTATRAMQIWIDWADKNIKERPKAPPKQVNNPAVAKFMPAARTEEGSE